MQTNANPHTKELIARTVDGLPALVPYQDAAQFLGCSTKHLRELRKRGELICLQRLAGTTSPVFVLRESIAEYLERITL